LYTLYYLLVAKAGSTLKRQMRPASFVVTAFVCVCGARRGASEPIFS
jgi:hypothetical protein